MTRCLCVATFDEDEDTVTLEFELADDRAVALTYQKNGDYTSVMICDNSVGFFDDCFATPEEFADWAKVALGALSPDRERRWLCQICKERKGFGPMLRDEIWTAIKAIPDPGYSDLMCWECMQKRATAIIGRKLTRQDVTQCPGRAKFEQAAS